MNESVKEFLTAPSLPGSILGAWIKAQLVSSDLREQIVDGEQARSLSLRMPMIAHIMLTKIAAKTGMSKTGCAQEILLCAITDTYSRFNLPIPTQEDLQAYAADTTRTE